MTDIGVPDEEDIASTNPSFVIEKTKQELAASGKDINLMSDEDIGKAVKSVAQRMGTTVSPDDFGPAFNIQKDSRTGLRLDRKDPGTLGEIVRGSKQIQSTNQVLPRGQQLMPSLLDISDRPSSFYEGTSDAMLEAIARVNQQITKTGDIPTSIENNNIIKPPQLKQNLTEQPNIKPESTPTQPVENKIKQQLDSIKSKTEVDAREPMNREPVKLQEFREPKNSAPVKIYEDKENFPGEIFLITDQEKEPVKYVDESVTVPVPIGIDKDQPIKGVAQFEGMNEFDRSEIDKLYFDPELEQYFIVTNQDGEDAPEDTKLQVPLPKNVNSDIAKALSLITTLEGFSDKPYKDGMRFSSGFGTKAKKNDKAISKTEAFQRAFKYFEVNVQPILNEITKTVNLNTNQTAAIASLIYNVGATQFTKSEAYKKLIAGDFPGFDKLAFGEEGFNKVGGKLNAGLVKRRKIESELFNTA
tara:strand:- start:265 stop:1677 length:1413 start_codon:yes stop_codon:yes gene_type:complete